MALRGVQGKELQNVFKSLQYLQRANIKTKNNSKSKFSYRHWKFFNIALELILFH
jgi:UDP-N-acetylenolpyruvoylglucosamine reductase